MERCSRYITAKFGIVEEILARTRPPPAPLRVELDAIRLRYALCTSHLFLQAAAGEAGRLQARADFERIVAAEGFVAELDGLVARAARAPGGGGDRRARQALGALFRRYAGFSVDCAAGAVRRSLGGRYDWCPECEVEMGVNAETSELECPACHRCRVLVGTVFEDAQFYGQEGQKAKSGSFNPNRHFRFWMDRILAREPEEELGGRGGGTGPPSSPASGRSSAGTARSSGTSPSTRSGRC